ncbi:MAG: septum formation protein Maf [Chloroflexi bacterium]|nr:septum formation protein Maf [Chloroflexota bacterium]
MQPRLILASASPRRRQLLAALGLAFDVVAADVDEAPRDDESPADLARRLALSKAQAVASDRPAALILAADTLVVIDGQVLGKPSSPDEAFEMLARLRNRQHLVISGLAIQSPTPPRQWVEAICTPVLMRDYTDAEIRHYVSTGDPMDKAGAYAIQHDGFRPIARLDGCYTNVMGLPLCHVYRCLEGFGVAAPVHPLDRCPYALGQGCVWAREILYAQEPTDP